ncbi:glycosyltransferase, partial [candidate division WWE3 bacterium]|nr:glycosyltransferase [candidate division WWE3 bacterium]
FVHDFLDSYGGAERLLHSMHEIYPDAPIFTTRFDPSALPDSFPVQSVREVTWLRNRLVKLFSKQLTFLYLIAFESINLNEYDVVISSSANFAKGILTRPDQIHINYCHTPPRFLYKYEGESDKRMKWYYAPFVSLLDSYLRIWDYVAAQRPDYFIANSKNTAARIKTFYHRDSTVIYPPVNIENHTGSIDSLDAKDESLKDASKSSFFLVVSRLAMYKHVELAIGVCNRLCLPLTVVGVGPEQENLEKLAGETVTFEGFVSDKRLSELYRSAKALIYTVRDEDFGMTPIEAMSYGCPVIAHRSGGTLETVIEGKTGEFFDEYSVDGLLDVVENFNSNNYTYENLIKRANDFSRERFQDEIRTFVDNHTQQNDNNNA